MINMSYASPREHDDANIIYQDYDGIAFRDIKGFPVSRTPHNYPYSYSEYCICKTAEWSNHDNVFYSDRFSSWYDPEKIKEARNELNIEHGDYFWDYYQPSILSKFLSKVMDEKITVTAIAKGCNVATGYPIWTIYYKTTRN